jgi:hypothetical protein
MCCGRPRADVGQPRGGLSEKEESHVSFLAYGLALEAIQSHPRNNPDKVKQRFGNRQGAIQLCTIFPIPMRRADIAQQHDALLRRSEFAKALLTVVLSLTFTKYRFSIEVDLR